MPKSFAGLSVAQRGEPILGLKAAPVAEEELGSEWLAQFSQVLYATMLERNGVGIAAPQVYLSNVSLSWLHGPILVIQMRLRWRRC